MARRFLIKLTKYIFSKMTTLYYYHKDFLHHDTFLGHPESPDRLCHINAELKQHEFKLLQRIMPQLRQDIIRLIRLVHTQAMIDKVLQKMPEDGFIPLDPDTILSAGSAHAALFSGECCL